MPIRSTTPVPSYEASLIPAESRLYCTPIPHTSVCSTKIHGAQTPAELASSQATAPAAAGRGLRRTVAMIFHKEPVLQQDHPRYPQTLAATPAPSAPAQWATLRSAQPVPQSQAVLPMPAPARDDASGVTSEDAL